ncbi:VacJ family lipoprotein [Aliiglaciecola sp. CAU 1673]|uniref:MlaA family lipoprotein n=1 Tax=Aliiglaciecola sp. CAU 1673 TaxID=3032595 RepID=UPI0023DA63C9|nr:VacJ family lipoprotein [Aliiglaciecola sp. CAU 1673]MDF2177494.1 VacJ family lipoprotein [Aliiglaciecola sp. CAU 1673]
MFLGLSLLLLGGCATPNNAEQQAQTNQVEEKYWDPLEPVNRAVWTFNWDYLDAYLVRPVAVVYRDYMPNFARKGLLNAAENLEEPSSSINNLLQGKVGPSMVSLGRFVINSTVGLLGTIDVAKAMGLERKEEEFGEVLGTWGVGTGPYLMVPAMGPNDVRSGVGDAVDSAYFPIDNLAWQLNIVRFVVKGLEKRIDLVQQEALLNEAVDPYAMVKDIYFQNLEFKVKDGQVEVSEEELQLDEDIDSFLDDL